MEAKAVYVAVTDNEWFDFLSKLKPDEVNFWLPNPVKQIYAIKQNDLVLFKLHAPKRAIGGGGVFVSYTILPISLAWQAFEKKNGADDITSMRERISRYRDISTEHDPLIGCMIIAQPFFLSEENWIPEPPDWKPSIQRGKSYLLDSDQGKWLLAQVQRSLERESIVDKNVAVHEPPVEYRTTRVRLGQGAFRVLVLDAYRRQCAVTGEKVLPVLEAAHIKPVSYSGPNEVNNGLALRADLHRLFERGYITVTPEYIVEVSRKVRADFDNGREYIKLHGKRLAILPDRTEHRPARPFLLWHNENCFLD